MRQQNGTGQLNTAMLKTVLLIEPDESQRFSMVRAFLPSDWLLVTVANVEEAAEALQRHMFLVIITSLKHADEIHRVANERDLECKIVVSVRFGDETSAGSTLPAWAYSVLRKPFAEHEVFQVLGFAWAFWRQRVMLEETGVGSGTFVSGVAA